jgi:DNA-binding NarL/FixJ family response regulator
MLQTYRIVGRLTGKSGKDDSRIVKDMTSRRNDISISVLFASPHAMTREVMMKALNRHRHFQMVVGAATGQEVLKAVQSTKVDVALIGATLADGPLSGLGTLQQIRECSPEVKPVILFYGPERHLVVDAFRAGARGVFCLSQASFKSLCRCVEQVHAGQIWANSSELATLVQAFSRLAPMRVVNADGLRLLTNREEDVVRLLAEGMQNREIANELKLSEHTVRNYLFHIFDKLGVSSRIELALYAVSSTKAMPTSGVQSEKQDSEPAGDLEMAGKLLTDEGNGVQAPNLPDQGGRKPMA